MNTHAYTLDFPSSYFFFSDTGTTASFRVAALSEPSRAVNFSTTFSDYHSAIIMLRGTVSICPTTGPKGSKPLAVPACPPCHGAAMLRAVGLRRRLDQVGASDTEKGAEALLAVLQFYVVYWLQGMELLPLWLQFSLCAA